MKKGGVHNESLHRFEAVGRGDRKRCGRGKKWVSRPQRLRNRLGQSAHRHRHKIAENHAD